MDNLQPSEIAKKLKLGEYEHYKGKKCEVLGVVRHSETLEEMVLYREAGNSSEWVRPIAMFFEDVEVNGKKIPRFKFLHE